MPGMLVIAIGYGAGLGLRSAAWRTVVVSVVIGAGIGLAYSSLPTLIIGAVDASETGAANGLNTLMRSIGTSVDRGDRHGAGPHLGARGRRGAEVLGFRPAFLIAVGAVPAGLVYAAFLPSRKEGGPAAAARGRSSGCCRRPAVRLPRPRADAGGTPVAYAHVTLIDRSAPARRAWPGRTRKGVSPSPRRPRGGVCRR